MLSVYSIVEMVLNEATEQYQGRLIVSEDMRERLKADCGIIDQLVSEFACDTANAEINDNTLALTITLTCPDMILEYGRIHPFFKLIQHTSSFSFSAEDDRLQVSFVFDGIWERGDRG